MQNGCSLSNKSRSEVPSTFDFTVVVNNKKLLALAAIIFCASFSARANNEGNYTSSLSVQVGINGTLQDFSSFGLQFIPPDVSYSHELFNNDVLNISTASFYDNIGVKIKGTNFSYRVGQRIDFGIELGKYLPYATLGFGVMRYSHHWQTSPVYGIGFLTRITERLLWVNELNFQDVSYQKSHRTITNISSGIVFAF